MHVSRMMGIGSERQTVDATSTAIGVGVGVKWDEQLRIPCTDVLGRNSVRSTKYDTLAVKVILRNHTDGELQILAHHPRVN